MFNYVFSFFFFLSNSYLNTSILFGDLFCFLVVFFVCVCLFFFFLMSYILRCSLMTRREDVEREHKRLYNIQELKLL